jgi:hypothetical protein
MELLKRKPRAEKPRKRNRKAKNDSMPPRADYTGRKFGGVKMAAQDRENGNFDIAYLLEAIADRRERGEWPEE